MPNLPPNPKHVPYKAMSKLFEQFLKEKMINFTPSALMTISLHKPLWSGDIRDDLCIDQALYHEFILELIKWIDRWVYGSRHHRLLNKYKFQFIAIVEVRTARGEKTMPHIHILFGMNCLERDKVKNRLEKFYSKIGKLCRKFGFEDDIDFRNHCSTRSGYIFKFAYENPCSIV